MYGTKAPKPVVTTSGARPPTASAAPAAAPTKAKPGHAPTKSAQFDQKLTAVIAKQAEQDSEIKNMGKTNAKLQSEIDGLKKKEKEKIKKDSEIKKIFRKYPLSEKFHTALQLRLNGRFTESLANSTEKFQRADTITATTKVIGGVVNLFTLGLGGSLTTALLDMAHINKQKQKNHHFASAFSGNPAKAAEMFERIANQIVIAWENLFPVLVKDDIDALVESIATQVKVYLKKVGGEISNNLHHNDELKFELLLFVIFHMPPLKTKNLKQQIGSLLGGNQLKFSDASYKDMMGKCTPEDFIRKPCVKYTESESDKEKFLFPDSKENTAAWPQEIYRGILYPAEPVMFRQMQIWQRQAAKKTDEKNPATAAATSKPITTQSLQVPSAPRGRTRTIAPIIAVTSPVSAPIKSSAIDDRLFTPRGRSQSAAPNSRAVTPSSIQDRVTLFSANGASAAPLLPRPSNPDTSKTRVWPTTSNPSTTADTKSTPIAAARRASINTSAATTTTPKVHHLTHQRSGSLSRTVSHPHTVPASPVTAALNQFGFSRKAPLSNPPVVAANGTASAAGAAAPKHKLIIRSNNGTSAVARLLVRS